MRSRRMGIVLGVLLAVALVAPASAWAKNAYATHIAFSRSGYINIIKPTSASLKRLSTAPANASSPVWDTTHKKVYFVRGDRWLVAADTTPEQIFVVTASSKKTVAVPLVDPGAPAGTQHAITSIACSRSGKYLYVADLTRPSDDVEYAIGRILRVNVATGATVELLREQAMTWNGYTNLDARKGGAHLLYVEVESDRAHLYELKLSTKTRRLVRAGIESACYTPGGSQVVGSSYFGTYTRDGLRRMSRTGKTLKTLRTWTRGDLNKAWRLPRYAPAGDRIAITKGMSGGLYTVTTKGTKIKKVASGPIAGIDW